MGSFELKVKVKEIPIGMLSENTGQIPDVPRNPRKITKEKFDDLCESIRQSPEMKYLDEIRVFPFNGRYVVISGNHRYKAYKKLGWENVLCKVLPEDTPKVKLREYVMKENMHYAENDEETEQGGGQPQSGGGQSQGGNTGGDTGGGGDDDEGGKN